MIIVIILIIIIIIIIVIIVVVSTYVYTLVLGYISEYRKSYIQFTLRNFVSLRRIINDY